MRNETCRRRFIQNIAPEPIGPYSQVIRAGDFISPSGVQLGVGTTQHGNANGDNIKEQTEQSNNRIYFPMFLDCGFRSLQNRSSRKLVI